MGLENECEPQDYLNFFCLGTRESSQVTQPTSNGKVSVAPNTPQALGITNRCFMIHVNSKGMIVDDEFVILGSANINQRSLEGTRDTEIAMGAYVSASSYLGSQRFCSKGADIRVQNVTMGRAYRTT